MQQHRERQRGGGGGVGGGGGGRGAAAFVTSGLKYAERGARYGTSNIKGTRLRFPGPRSSKSELQRPAGRRLKGSDRRASSSRGCHDLLGALCYYYTCK